MHGVVKVLAGPDIRGCKSHGIHRFGPFDTLRCLIGKDEGPTDFDDAPFMSADV